MRQLAQPLCGRHRCIAGYVRSRHLERAHMADHHVVEDVLFRLVIMINQRFRDGAAFGDVGDRRAAKALGRKQRRSGVNDRRFPLVIISGLSARHGARLLAPHTSGPAPTPPTSTTWCSATGPPAASLRRLVAASLRSAIGGARPRCSRAPPQPSPPGPANIPTPSSSGLCGNRAQSRK